MEMSLFVLYAFVLGSIIGSFLNVVAYRMHTGRTLGGRSHCMSCGKGLRWYELLPIVSYISLRGACRGCHASVPMRYVFIELLTACIFGALAFLYIESPLLLLWWFLVSAILLLIALYDVRHTIIPNELTVCMLGAALVYPLITHASPFTFSIWQSSLIGALLGFIFFGSLWYVSKGRWLGFGDAKLAGVFGFIVGGGSIFSMIILSFWVGAAVSLLCLGIQKFYTWWTTRLRFLPRTLTMKSEVPFAPFLIAGFVLVQIFNVEIFSITTRMVDSFFRMF